MGSNPTLRTKYSAGREMAVFDEKLLGSLSIGFISLCGWVKPTPATKLSARWCNWAATSDYFLNEILLGILIFYVIML